MTRLSKIIVLIAFFTNVIAWANATTSEYDKNWPTWRGPYVTGEAPDSNPPITWSENSNIRWKVGIPGKGLSSPVIWGDQIFITTAIETEKAADSVEVKAQGQAHADWMTESGQAKTSENFQQFVVFSISRESGDILWQKIVREAYPHEGVHIDGSWSSPSCAVDGEHVLAFFGSYGLYCLDLKGNLIWQKDFGDMSTRNAFGEGSSPAIYGDYVIVNWDHEGDSHIYVLDKNSGDIIWQKDRDERTSWSTPIVVDVNGKPQIIVSATTKSRGYDLANGEVIWELGGLTVNVIPTPVYADGFVYLMSGFRGNILQTVKLEQAKGDIQNSDALLWTYEEDSPYTPSSLLYQGKLYFFKGNKERLTCLNAKTGEVYFSDQKLEGMKNVYASPVGAADRVYIAGRNGAVYVIKNSPQFEVLAVNTLDDGFDASPAIVGNEIYLRGLKWLYCIREE